MNAVIDVRGLTKKFGGKTVVDHVDIEVGKGEIVGFLGPNGSGKTTTIRMLCGLLKPNAGEGTCLGFDVLEDSDRIKARTGYMTQHFSFYKDLTIAENLDFVARLFDLSPRRQAVEEAMAQHGLAPRRNQLTGTLSGGWKQRVALAASVMHNPELLLLDEPTAGVDPKARREFWDYIHELAARGLTVLVTTHYMDEAERCHRIIYISRGRVITRGGVDEVVEEAGLITWIVSGPDLVELEHELQSEPGIDQTATFGRSLHVIGAEREALERAIAPYREDPRYRWREGETSLEHVFIKLMGDDGGEPAR